MLCTYKDCSKKMLCNQCMIRHNPQHYQMIQAISDIEYQISQVPQLIERDLEQLKTKLYGIQNHIVFEKEQIKIQIIKMTEVLKSRLQSELDEFKQSAIEYMNTYYRTHEENIGNVLAGLSDHLKTVTPYATRVRPINENQFSLLLDFQEKMLTNVMPGLTKKVDLMNKEVFDNPLHIKVDNFYAIIKTYLNKALQTHNLFTNNQIKLHDRWQLENRLEENKLYNGISKSAVFESNDYKLQAQEMLRDHIHIEPRSTKALNRYDNIQDFNLPKLQKHKESKSQSTLKSERIPYISNRVINSVLSGHVDIITCLCVLNDTQLISGGGGGLIKLWDMDSGISLGDLNGHGGDVWSIVKINEINVASSSSDKTIRVWNIQKMSCDNILVGHLEAVRCLVYMRDIDYLVSGGFDMAIKVWQVARGKIKMTIQESQKVKCFCYIEIKGLLLSGGDSGRIKVFNILNGYCRDQLEGHQGEVCALRHLQDSFLGEQISVAASGGIDMKIIIWNVDKAIKLYVFVGHTDTINAIAYDSSNLQLWSAGSDRTIRGWDLIKNKLIISVRRHSDLISCIEFFRDSVITGSWDHRIRITARSYFFN